MSRETESVTLIRGANGDVAIEPTERLQARPRREDRYQREEPLGEGGMGVVESCLDRQIGRFVAMKRMRPSQCGGEGEARFVREARVQGRLEHPAIVPVYDLGCDADGAPWFTMKRIRGVTLECVIDALRVGEPLGARFSRRKLLSAFSNVCLAVHYAHERGVLHRDLKPSNVMLGDFGEVYVLDWGLARIAGASEPAEKPVAEAVGGSARVQAEGGQTQPGDVMGTPGYMAPEQMLGDPALMGPAADCYALGAILFEILALEPLHEAQTIKELYARTAMPVDPAVWLRAGVPEREAPPELQALVMAATRLDPRDRLGSARELHDAVERFLDGERDVELRRELAERHAGRAADLAARALDEPDPGNAARKAALGELGRALALDPGHAKAIALFVKLLAEPPHDKPPEVEEEMLAHEREALRRLGKLGAAAYTSMLLLVPLFVWTGVRAWGWLLCAYALLLAAAAVCAVCWRARTPSSRLVPAVMALSCLGLAATSPLFGPLIMTPMAIAVNSSAFVVRSARLRWFGVGTACLLQLAAVGLSLAGLLPGGYAFGAAGMLVRPGTLDLSGKGALAVLVATSLAAILVGIIPVGILYDGLIAAQRRLALHGWHLRALAPRHEAAGGS